MCQISFSDFEYAGQRKQTHHEAFLIEKEQVVPWSRLLKLIEPYYTKAGDGRNRHPLEPLVWQTATRLSTDSKLNRCSLIAKAKRKIEYANPQMRAKAEHLFRVIKRQFGYVNLLSRGLMKNTTQLTTLFALSNLWMARTQLMGMGELRV